MSDQLQPDCENCDFFKRNARDAARPCQKHAFVMPRIGWPTLCRDWRHRGQALDLDLEPERLYYYSHDGDRLAELAPFEALQRLLLSVRVRHDEGLGWVIVPRQGETALPAPESAFKLVLEGQSYPFRVTYAARQVALGARNMNGRGTRHHMEHILMLYSADAPDLLRHWLSAFVDFDAFSRERLAPSFFAFLEIDPKGGRFALHPDLLTYGPYQR